MTEGPSPRAMGCSREKCFGRSSNTRGRVSGRSTPPSAATCSAQTPTSSSMTTSKPPFRWCARSNGPDRRSAGLSPPIPGRRSPNVWPGRRGCPMARRDRRTRTPEKKKQKLGRRAPVRRDSRVCRSRHWESGYGRSRTWISCVIPRTSGCPRHSRSSSAGFGCVSTKRRWRNCEKRWMPRSREALQR